MPILSVRAITIRLWIISLDHCFRLLCWLGAIHLPPPSKAQALLNCLSHCLLPPPPQPQSHLMILICPLLYSSILLKSELSWSPKPVVGVYRPLRTKEHRPPPPCLSSPNALTFTSTDTRHILHDICKGHLITTDTVYMIEIKKSVCHEEGMSWAAPLMVQRVLLCPLGNNMFWFLACASWQCAKIEGLIELPGVFSKTQAGIFPWVLSKLPFFPLFLHSAILKLTEQ